MNLIKCFQTHSTWYKGAKMGRPIGVLWHDTGIGNPTLKRYVQPYEGDENYDELMALLGKNKYGNDWNHINHEAGLNAWIGKLADGSIATIQAGEWERHPWGCGGGTLGSCNGYIKVSGKTTWTEDFWLQFEICDDGYGDKDYFLKAYKEACEFTAYICKLFNIDPFGKVLYNGVSVPTILCHADSYKLKLGENHGDIYSWFKKYGYTMDNVRNDVAALLAEEKEEPTTKEETPDYSIFKENTLVSIKKGATYYNGKTIPDWVAKQNWYVAKDATSDRVVINKSENGKHSINSPVHSKYLEVVNKVVEEKEEVVKKEVYPGTPSTGSKADEKAIWDYLLAKIGNEYGVAGLMGNLYAESALRSNNLQQTYLDKKIQKLEGRFWSDKGYNNFVNDMKGNYPAFLNGGFADFTGLAWMDGTKSKPEAVLDAEDTQNFIALRDVLAQLASDNVGFGNPLYSSFAPMSYGSNIPNFGEKLAQILNSYGETNIENHFEITIPIEKVEDYNDFVTKLQKDGKFEKMIRAMTVDQLTGGSPLAKYNYSWKTK